MFKLADIVSLYKQRHKQFGKGSSNSDIHSTRLTVKLLAEFNALDVVSNVKKTKGLICHGGGGGVGGSTSKTVSICYMLNSKNRVCNLYF